VQEDETSLEEEVKAQQQIETNYLETNLEEEVEDQQQLETNYLHRDLPT